MRSKRTQDAVMPPSTYELLRATCTALPPQTQHLVVLSGIPLVFPKVRPLPSVCCLQHSCAVRLLSSLGGMYQQGKALDGERTGNSLH